MAAEIILLNANDFTSQTYGEQDVNLISTFDVNTSFTTSSYVEFFIYDNNQNILSTTYNFSQYTVLNDGQSPGTNNDLSQIEINPEENLINLGYDQGQYTTYYNFFNKQVGSDLQQLYISEISSDRTEIRLDSTSLTNTDIVEQANSLIQQREDSPYFLDFYLNFGDNQLAIANNIQLDDQDPNNPTILIKLYEALPNEFDINSTLWVVTLLEESIAYQVTFEDTPIIISDTIPVKGPNFNLEIKDQINNSTVSLDYSQLTTTLLTSSFNQLSSLLEEKEIDINVDYTDFSNFTHFSSTKTRLENFYYKVELIEQYLASINTLNNTTNNDPSSNIAIYEAKINDIITNFDGYDYYLYYTSGSWAWPKTTSQPPYSLAASTSPEVLTWFGSDNEYNQYYGGIILSASNFDNNNQNNLYYAIPEYLREDPANNQYQLFIEMVGQFYDNIWIYYKDVTEKYNADNRLENGISKDIVADAIRDFGIKLYQNNFSNEDLYTAFLGLTPDGALFPFPNITDSFPTPSGFEYVDTLISASNDYMPLDDVNKSLYKRIYHNLPYLLKAKGTLPALRTLITSYGISDTILRINEYGGKDKVNLNDWDFWQDTFNYSFYTTGSNYVKTTYGPVNLDWNTNDGVPDSISFRFKTNGLPKTNIPYSQSLWNVEGNRLHLTLKYTGTGYDTHPPTQNNPLGLPYSGSNIDPYYQYAHLEFYPSYTIDPTISCSIYLPFFDGEWWSVMINREGNNFNLLTGNNVYKEGNNGTSIGFFNTSSAVANDLDWRIYGSSYFGKGNVTINAELYNSFSGSLQEIRYFKSPLTENIFKDYIMNPYSIEGNQLNSSPNELIFRASLGGELYTGSTSIHPKVSGDWITTSSFALDSNFSFGVDPTFNPNTEYFFYDQPAVGIKNPVSDKIRLENSVIPYGNTLSPFRSLAQEISISQSYTANTNLLEVAFSPQDEINDDISSQMGYFNIGEYIGDPRLRSSSAESYPALDKLRNDYFEKYTSNYNFVDYIRLIKFFDNSLFKMIRDFVPARTSLASGIVIKQHFLERNKYPQPQVNTYSTTAYTTSGSKNNVPFIFQDISVSGTIAPQWNDYNPGTVENFSGGTGGSLERFNYVSNTSQSWIENIQTTLGLVSTLHNNQDEFYDGEFSGSTITVDNGELNESNYLKQPQNIPLNYNTTGSTFNYPSPGNLTWQSSLGSYSSGGKFLYVSSICINEVDLNGNNLEVALSNLISGNRITFNISGSVDDGLTTVYSTTLEGTVTSVVGISPTVWKINLSPFMGSQAIYYPALISPQTFTQTPGIYPNSPIYLDPYINNTPNFYYSDFNPIMNNVEDERLSTKYEKIDYYPGITTPTNFDLIISGSALKASVQDSNYSSKRIINPRYDGVKSTNQYLNVWTPGDTGNYGKTPSTQNLKTMVAYCDWISGWPPDRMNASAIHIQYLIKSDGSIVIPNISDNSLFDNKGTFESGERIIIEPKTISSGLPTQYRNILRGGTRIEPILYTQIGHTPPNWTSSLNLWNDNVNYPVSDVTRLSVLNPLSSGNPIAQLLPFPGATQTLGTTTAGASQGWTILYDPASTTFGSGNYDYNVSTIPNPVVEGTNLIVDAKIKLQNFSTVDSSVIKIQLRNSFIGANPSLETQFISLSPNEIKTAVFYRSLTPGVDYNDTNAKGDIYFLIENDGPSSICGVLSSTNETYFNVKQNPLPNPLPSVLTGSNRIWNYPTSSTYNQHSSSAQGIIFIPDTTSSLNIYYNTPGVHQSDITQSGFNSITLDWSVKYGDEFRFEGVEDRTYTVKQVFEPTDQSSERISNTGSLEVHLDKALPSQSINLDHFLIRRYVDDASTLIMEGFKPINTSGPYIVRPEYIVPELNKTIDEFILDLTQKGLIT